MPNRLLLLLLMAALACGFAAADRRERVAVVAPAHYEGALMVQQPLDALAKQAKRIVVGKVTDVSSFKSPGTIKTRVKIAVSKEVKGKGSDQITLTLEGGSVGNERLNVGGVPFFLKDEKVLLLLDGSADPKIVGAWQGKYSLAGSQAHTREGKSKSIQTIEKELSSALNEPVDLPEDSQEVTSLAFTTYCEEWSDSDVPGFWDGSAWVPTPNADLAVGFEVNTASPGSGGPTGSNFARVIYNSWHNWQALTNSHPSFAYVGTTSRNGTNHLDGHNTIAWANLGSGTLGINYCASAGGVRVDSDTLINNTLYTWDYDDSNGISGSAFSLQAVLEHELGHGLGLGHSDQTCDGGSSTPLMCPAVSNGIRKTIKTDDSNGAASRYPHSGNIPGAPGSLTVTGSGTSRDLSWTASSGTPLAYDIERRDSACTGSATWVSVGTVDSRTYGYDAAGDPISTSAVTSFVDNNFGGGLAAGTYCYRIKALGAGGDSAWVVASQLPVYGVTWDSHGTPSSLPLASTTTVPVSFTNAGSLTWAATGGNAVRLSYHWRGGACPGSSSVLWDGPRASLSGDVSSNESVTGLNIPVTAPSSAGTYCLVYDLVREGVAWFSSQGANTLRVTVSVTQALPVYAITWNSDTTPSSMVAGAAFAASVNITNTGSLTWQAAGANPVRVSYHWRNGACPGGSYALWDGPRAALSANMATGQSASVNVNGTAPTTAGTYCLVYDMVREGAAWFSSQGANIRQKQVTVQAPVYGVNWGAHNTPTTMAADSTMQVAVSFTNTGSLTWQSSGDDSIRLSYHWRTGACPGTAYAVWNGPRAFLSSNVTPGGTVSGLNIPVTAPSTPGSYCLVYDLVREGIAWFSSQGANVNRVNVTVQ